jgi:uncharacterized OB-fold protein
VASLAQDPAEFQSPGPRPSLLLKASRNRESGLGVFPRIPDASPAAPRFEPIELSATATLYSFTVIHPSPKTGLEPFALIYADFPEAVRVFGRLDLPAGQRPEIGMTVRPVAVERDGGGQSYVFVPYSEALA